VFRGELAEKFKHAASGGDPLDLYGELAAARTLAAAYIEKVQLQSVITIDQADAIIGWMGEIGALASKIVEARNDTALTRAEILFVTAQMESAVRDFIPDPEQRRAFIQRIRSAIPGRLVPVSEDTDAERAALAPPAQAG
jgi:hypothetical protein